MKQFTEAEYRDAFDAVIPTATAKQLAMLRFHFTQPGHTVSMRQLAEAVGYSGIGGAKLQYGKFAGMVCRRLNANPQHNVSILANFVPHGGDDGEWGFQLWPEVVDALEGFDLGSDLEPKEESPEPGMEPELGLREGAATGAWVDAYERNPVARRRCIEAHGLGCAVCGVVLSSVYGPVAERLIHVHHLESLASRAEDHEVDPVLDLRPVCPNCHAVIHLRPEAFSLEEVRAFITSAGSEVANSRAAGAGTGPAEPARPYTIGRPRRAE